MKQEEKELLLIDLCARAPYGVKIHLETPKYGELIGTLDAIYPTEDRVIVDNLDKAIAPINVRYGGFKIEENRVKPYLRPMSSMTEEEKVEYCNLQDRFLCSSQYPVTDAYELFDWLNAHHFDYRGLIEKDLALVAKEDMYKTKTVIIEEIKTWWKSYKEILKPDELICIEDPCEMILKWADYNERDLGLYDLETLEEIAKELNIFKI